MVNSIRSLFTRSADMLIEKNKADHTYPMHMIFRILLMLIPGVVLVSTPADAQMLTQDPSFCRHLKNQLSGKKARAKARTWADLACRDYLAMKQKFIKEIQKVTDEATRTKAEKFFRTSIEHAENGEKGWYVLHGEITTLIMLSKKTRTMGPTIAMQDLTHALKEIYPRKYEKKVKEIYSLLDSEEQRLEQSELLSDTLLEFIETIRLEVIYDYSHISLSPC